MAASAPDREKKGKGPRCFSKSRPPRLSVGPPNGVRDDPKSEDRQWGNPGTVVDGPVSSKDPELDAGPEPLSESDIIRISRCVLQLLVEPRRPEDEGEVGPQLASRVLASFGSLAKQLRADLYRVGREGQHYFDPRHAVNRGHHHQDSGSASPPRVSSSSPPPLHASEGGVAEARGAEGDGPRIARPQRPPVARGTVVMAGPPWGQPGALPPAFVPHALQGGPFVGHGLVWDPLRAAELEASWCRQAVIGMQEALARAHEAHALEVRRLLLELELVRMRLHQQQASPPPSAEALPALGESGVGAKQETPQGEVAPPAAGDPVHSQGLWECRALRPPLSPAAPSWEPEELHELALRPREDAMLDIPGDHRQDWGRELHRFTEPSGGVLQLRATGPGSERSLDGDKVQAKMARVVAMVREQLPTCPEPEIWRHVEHVRSLQHGFSGMAFHSIVALVLGHIKGLSSHGQP